MGEEETNNILEEVTIKIFNKAAFNFKDANKVNKLSSIQNEIYEQNLQTLFCELS
jgi:hypothetical protein